LVGFPGRRIGPSQGLYLHTGQRNTKKTRTLIHASSGIRTHDPSVLADVNSACLRPRGRWGWLHIVLRYKI